MSWAAISSSSRMISLRYCTFTSPCGAVRSAITCMLGAADRCMRAGVQGNCQRATGTYGGLSIMLSPARQVTTVTIANKMHYLQSMVRSQVDTLLLQKMLSVDQKEIVSRLSHTSQRTC